MTLQTFGGLLQYVLLKLLTKYKYADVREKPCRENGGVFYLGLDAPRNGKLYVSL